MLRIYADTSVLGGCHDREFAAPSQRLLTAFVRGNCRLVLSELTLAELAEAPIFARNTVASIPPENIERSHYSPEADELANRYIHEGAISLRMRADALHIAMATLAAVDVLVSWNFRHIVNLRQIHAYNEVNRRLGYTYLEIRTPIEVSNDD